MKTMTRALFSGLLIATPLAAQGASFTFNYGDAQYGGSFVMSASASFTQPSRLLASYRGQLAGTTKADIRLGSDPIEAFMVRGSSDGTFSAILTRMSASITNDLLIRVGGFTVYQRTSTASAGIGGSLSPLNTYGSRGWGESVSVLGIGIAISGNATADVDYTLTPGFSIVPLGMQLTLNGTAEINGTARASVSAFGQSAGLSALIDLADPRATAQVSAGLTPAGGLGASGSISWSVDSIRVRIDAVLSGLINATVRLIDMSLPGTQGTYNF